MRRDLEALNYFEVPTPPDLFRWWRLITTAAVRKSWPAMSQALDAAREAELEHDRDWSHAVLRTAADSFEEFTLEYDTFRYWASFVMPQLEARQ